MKNDSRRVFHVSQVNRSRLASLFGLISLKIVLTAGMREDRVCYVRDSTPACDQHFLTCGTKEIAILSAEYSYTTNCTCIKKRCTTCSSEGRTKPLESTETCLKDLYNEDYWNIVNTCSKRNDCFVPAPRLRYQDECSRFTTFSHVRYRCVDDKYELTMCKDGVQVGKHVSLFYDGSKFANASQQCLCTIKGNNLKPTDMYNITVLSIQTGDGGDEGSSELVLKSGTDVYPVSITDTRPNTLLLRTSVSNIVQLGVKSNLTDKIWIAIEGSSDVNVTCQLMAPSPKWERMKSVAGGGTVAGTVGGTVGGLLMLILVTAVIVLFIRKKRRRTVTKKTDHLMTMKENEHLYSLIEDSPLESSSVQNANSDLSKTQSTSTNAAFCESNEMRYVDIDVHEDKLKSHGDYVGATIEQIPDSQEDCYNCLQTSGTNHAAPGANYDTMMSAMKTVKGLECVDDFDNYDHVGQLSVKVTVMESDYDTTLHEDKNIQATECQATSEDILF